MVMPKRATTSGLGLAALIAICLGPRLGLAQKQGQKWYSVPKFLSDSTKDLFDDVMSDEITFGEAACEGREKLLKDVVGRGEQEATQIRTMVLLRLAQCDFKKGLYQKSALRFASAISEMNAPSEDALLARPETAPIPLWKHAAEHLSKHRFTEAGIALRRTRVIQERNLKTMMKRVHKQMGGNGQQVPPVETLLEEIQGYGKTGNMLPQLLPSIAWARDDFSMLELLDQSIEQLDKQMALSVASLKLSRQRLDKGKSASKDGVLLYVKTLVADPVSDGENALVAQELENGGAIKALLEEAKTAEKPLTLLKRTKEGKDCSGDNGLKKTCDALQKVSDLASNGFGETRLLVVKAGKKQQLEVCSTNANVGILVAVKSGAKLVVKDRGNTKTLEVGKPVVIDFCLEAALMADSQTPVLFAQAWHPEFAAVERTNELRLRSKAFGLNEAEIKKATDMVNAHAKKSWDKTAKAWRQGSAIVDKLRSDAEAEAELLKQQEKEKEEAKRKAELDGDEERKRGLEELEKKRAQKRLEEGRAAEKKRKRQEVIEQERAMRDPWLNAPEVKEVEQKLDDLKEQRRDANAKLEFEVSTALTKEISAAERELKSVIKKAKKAYKKKNKAASDGAASKAPAQSAQKADLDAFNKKKETFAQLREELEDFKKKKKEAVETEDFKEAKKLKQQMKAIEEKLGNFDL